MIDVVIFLVLWFAVGGAIGKFLLMGVKWYKGIPFDKGIMDPRPYWITIILIGPIGWIIFGFVLFYLRKIGEI